AAVLEDIGGIGGVRRECVLARDRQRLILDGGWRRDRRTRYRETQDTSNDGQHQSHGLHGFPLESPMWKPSEPLGPSAGPETTSPLVASYPPERPTGFGSCVTICGTC